MINKFILVSIVLLQAQLAWGIESARLGTKCVSKAELVERMTQHLMSGSESDSTLVERAAKTRLGVSLQQRLRQLEDREFNDWLKFQKDCADKDLVAQTEL